MIGDNVNLQRFYTEVYDNYEMAKQSSSLDLHSSESDNEGDKEPATKPARLIVLKRKSIKKSTTPTKLKKTENSPTKKITEESHDGVKNDTQNSKDEVFIINDNFSDKNEDSIEGNDDSNTINKNDDNCDQKDENNTKDNLNIDIIKEITEDESNSLEENNEKMNTTNSSESGDNFDRNKLSEYEKNISNEKINEIIEKHLEKNEASIMKDLNFDVINDKYIDEVIMKSPDHSAISQDVEMHNTDTEVQNDIL